MGCWTGIKTQLLVLSNLIVSVIEPNKDLITSCKKNIIKINSNLNLPHFYNSKLEDMHILPVKEFNISIMEAVLGFISDIDIALNNLSKSLEINGLVCVNDFFYKSKPPENILNEINTMIGSHFSYEKSSHITDIFSKNGFKCIHWKEIPLEKISNEYKQSEKERCNQYETLNKLFNINKKHLGAFLGIFQKFNN